MFTDSLNKLWNAFDSSGFKLRIVGGAVRDHLLGLKPKDIDLCTDATPVEMLAVATYGEFKYLPTGLQHGTVTFVVDGDCFEVTTLRVDVTTDGRHAEVMFTKSFEADASRRDLTINAMSMDRDGNIFDYFGGREDLNSKCIRFVGDADTRVKEDYLRILRYFRFAARFGLPAVSMPGGNVQYNQIKAITAVDNLEGLKAVSVERYWMEMQKLVMMPYARDTLFAMSVTGVLRVLGLQVPWTRYENVDAITALSTMLNEATVYQFVSTWKMSSDESSKLLWLVNNTRYDLTVEDAEDMLVDGVPLDWVTNLFNLMQVQFDSSWVVPVFPVTGQMMLDRGFLPGKLLGDELRRLRWDWKDSRFTLTAEQLLN